MGNESTALHEDRLDSSGFDFASLDFDQRQRVNLFLAKSARYLGLSDGGPRGQPATACCPAPPAIERPRPVAIP
ncbi:MAG: hypothetical protein PVI91_06725 [Gammaproteobacteria bacterium]|jgi:hypothetical protein